MYIYLLNMQYLCTGTEICIMDGFYQCWSALSLITVIQCHTQTLSDTVSTGNTHYILLRVENKIRADQSLASLLSDKHHVWLTHGGRGCKPSRVITPSFSISICRNVPTFCRISSSEYLQTKITSIKHNLRNHSSLTIKQVKIPSKHWRKEPKNFNWPCQKPPRKTFAWVTTQKVEMSSFNLAYFRNVLKMCK